MGLIGTLPANSVNNSYKETITNMYYKVMGVMIDTEKEKVLVPVRGWLSEYARHNQGIGVFKRVFYIPMDYFKDTICTSDELIKKSYEYIKTLPEFDGCIDALEDYDGLVDITEEQVEEEKKTLEEMINSLR
jgi:hypothetical protein